MAPSGSTQRGWRWRLTVSRTDPLAVPALLATCDLLLPVSASSRHPCGTLPPLSRLVLCTRPWAEHWVPGPASASSSGLLLPKPATSQACGHTVIPFRSHWGSAKLQRAFPRNQHALLLLRPKAGAASLMPGALPRVFARALALRLTYSLWSDPCPKNMKYSGLSANGCSQSSAWVSL